MSFLERFFTALGRALGYVADNADNPENRPKPVPITTREELGWDEEPTSKGDKPS
jgi:hypothetical protein